MRNRNYDQAASRHSSWAVDVDELWGKLAFAILPLVVAVAQLKYCAAVIIIQIIWNRLFSLKDTKLFRFGIMPFFGRLRRSSKPKAECTDHCCYVNTGYAAPSLSEASITGRSSKSSTKSDGSLKSRPILHRSETFTMKDGPPDNNLPELLKSGTYSKKKGKFKQRWQKTQTQKLLIVIF